MTEASTIGASRPGALWRDLGRVVRLWRGHRAGLVGGALVAAASALLGVALLALAGVGAGASLNAASLSAASLSAEGLAAGGAAGVALWLLRPLVLLRPAARWAERMATHAATFGALADTRVWFFGRLAARLPGGIGLRRSGDLLGRLVVDVEALDRLYLGAVVPGVAALAVLLAVLILLGGAPALALLVALPLACALLLPLLLAPAAAEAALRVAAAEGDLRNAAVDPLLGLEDTLAVGGEARAGAAVAHAGGVLAAAQARLARHGAGAGAAGVLLGQAALLGALGWGLAQAPSAGPGVAGLGVAGLALLGLFLAIAAVEPLSMLPRAGAALAAAGAGARRLFEAADTPVPTADPARPAPLPTGHALRIEGLRFSWAPDRPEVFAGLDLDLPEGARVVLLGPSGSGKSSLAALLLRLAEPAAGRMTLGGTDLAALPAAAVRGRIACLTQDARLFDDTIAANLRLAAPGAPDAALWRALDRAGIGELARTLPEGLATRCGEGGARFSGGQARRLALARVLLSPAPVLLLDEPTAGLDAAAEAAFLATLETATAGRSVLLLTHRLTGAERPTRVLRLVGGRALPATG